MFFFFFKVSEKATPSRWCDSNRFWPKFKSSFIDSIVLLELALGPKKVWGLDVDPDDQMTFFFCDWKLWIIDSMGSEPQRVCNFPHFFEAHKYHVASKLDELVTLLLLLAQIFWGRELPPRRGNWKVSKGTVVDPESRGKRWKQWESFGPDRLS